MLGGSVAEVWKELEGGLVKEEGLVVRAEKRDNFVAVRPIEGKIYFNNASESTSSHI